MICTWPTAQTGARSQAPMQGARTTRTSVPSLSGSSCEQLLGARHRAGQRIAHAHGDRRRRRLAFLHHVEMRVEGRDLVDLGQRHLHLGGERGEMRGGEMAVVVLDEMQMLDQQIAPARPVGRAARAPRRARPGRPGGPWACAAGGGGRLRARCRRRWSCTANFMLFPPNAKNRVELDKTRSIGQSFDRNLLSIWPLSLKFQ